MGLGSYQNPGEEIGGAKSTSTSSSKSSSPAANPASYAGQGYVSMTPSAAAAASTSQQTYGFGDSNPASYAGQGYVSMTPSAAQQTSGFGDSSPNPSIPTGGSYVVSTPNSGVQAYRSNSDGATFGYVPVGGGLMPNISISDAGGMSMTARSSRLASIPGYSDLVGTATPTASIGATSTLKEIESYIRAAAEARGIDPDTAVRVAKQEHLNTLTTAKDGYQSVQTYKGEREPSYSPYALLVGAGSKNFGPGLGDEFIRETGLDPRDPKNTQAAIDWSLDYAARNGWSKWNGAKAAGIDAFDGLDGAQAIGINAPVAAPSATPATQLASMWGAPVPESRPYGNPDGKGLARLVPADPPTVRVAGANPAADFGLKYVHPEQVLRDQGLTDILEDTALAMGRDLTIQSGYRGPNHPIEKAKPTGPGQHSKSAADINMSGMTNAEKKELVVALRERGVNRFIVYTKSPNLLHVDMKDQNGDGSAYFMVDKTGKNNAIKNGPQWYQDAAKVAADVKVAGVTGTAPTRVAGGLIPTPADRPSQAVSATGTGSASSGRQQSEAASAQTFRDKYIEPKQEPGIGKKLAAGAIDIGAGLIPGVGTAASIFNAGASLAGKQTIGQRIVNGVGGTGVASADSGMSGTYGFGESVPVWPQVAEAKADDEPSTFESKYIRPPLVDGGWMTPQEKWGRA